jgi:hypothetical protein
LASYLFVIALDYAMREALNDQTLGIKYITDLDFADDIMLISDNAVNAAKQLDSVDATTRGVALKIDRAKTDSCIQVCLQDYY